MPVRITGAICWILTLIYFLVQPIVAAAWNPPYSFTANTISDLGNASSPRHILMNVTFVVVGLLTAAGAFLLRDHWPRTALATWGLAFVGLSGVGAVMVGLAPADVNRAVHGFGALLQLPGAVGPFLLGLATIPPRRVERAYSIVVGLIGAIASLLFFADLSLGLGRGTMERLGFDPLTLWMIIIGMIVVRWRS